VAGHHEAAIDEVTLTRFLPAAHEKKRQLPCALAFSAVFPTSVRHFHMR
jgi:hypothetical protein